MDDVTAIETITRDCYRSLAGFPNAIVIDDDSMYAVISHIPIPFFNGVARTSLDADDVESRFEFLRAQQCPFRWWVTPSTRPEGLGRRLIELGLVHAYDSPGMIADLTRVPLAAAAPDRVTIKRLEHAAEMEDWLNVFMAAFALPEERRAIFRNTYTRIGFGDAVAWQHFVAFDDDVPVATSSVHIDGDLAGVYFVATLAEARGRGIGAAVTRESMRFAGDSGATRAALQSSDIGFNVYRSLGFEHRCDVGAYEWRRPM
ncbi:MAG TPA: GNAT family N-acetyltransferase [Thermoanaerobaculia bacterium]|nr:GNAT family N-acetyltransferase [Thermoanaerobaculia bacterium]